MDKKQKSSPTKDNVGAFFQTCKVCISYSYRILKCHYDMKGQEVRSWEIASNFIKLFLQTFLSPFDDHFFMNNLPAH